MFDPDRKSGESPRDTHTEHAQDFRTAMWLIGGISLFWSLGMVWAHLGPLALVLVTLGLNQAINRLGRALPPMQDDPAEKQPKRHNPNP